MFGRERSGTRVYVLVCDKLGDMLIQAPKMSFLVVDPGGITGFVAYDGWNDVLWGDQWLGHDLDMSPTQKLAGKHRVRSKVAWELMREHERTVVRRLLTLLHALGPKTTVVFEDFVLGLAGNGQRGFGSSGGREGLAPARINAMWDLFSDVMGAWNGDLWRRYPAGLMGIDPRGAIVDKFGAVYWRMSLLDRMSEPLTTSSGGSSVLDVGVWGHGGAEMWYQMPAERSIITDERMRMWEIWSPNKPHLNDAMRHFVVRCRKLGVGSEILRKPELLRRPAMQKKVQDRT